MKTWTDDEYKLCYIDGPWAYFTTQPLEKQWGDDWNDAPYEHNAGEPYLMLERDRALDPDAAYDIRKVAFESPMETPAGLANGNSRYSVEQINAGCVAWLAPNSWSNDENCKPIHAGTTLPEFRKAVVVSGGKVYEERRPT